MPRRSKPNPPRKKHNKTQLSTLEEDGGVIIRQCHNSVGGYFKNSSKCVVPNFHFMDEDFTEHCKYFILDHHDIAMSDAENKKNSKFLENLTEFMRAFNCKKKIYIRQLDTRAEGRFLTDDVIEIIPLVLRQQGNPIEESDGRLQRLRDKWAPPKDVANRTMTFGEFEEVLEVFDVNKSLITLTPDFENFARKETHFKNMRGYVCHVNHNGDEVVFANQAMYHLFLECVVGYDWNVSSCAVNQNCGKDKQLLKDMMCVYKQLNDDEQVLLEHVKEQHDFIKAQRNFVHQANAKNTDYLFFNSNHEAPAPNEELIKIAKRFNILQPLVPKLDPNKSKYPVWLARIVLFAGWISSFYDREEAFAKNVLIDIVCSMVTNGQEHRAKRTMNEYVFAPSSVLPQPVDSDEDDDVDDEEEEDDFEDDESDVDSDLLGAMLRMRTSEQVPEAVKELFERTKQDIFGDEQNLVVNSNLTKSSKNTKKTVIKQENDGWKDYSEGQNVMLDCDSVVLASGERYVSNYSFPGIPALEKPEKKRFYFNITKYGPIFNDIEFDEHPLLNLEAYSKCADEFVVRSMKTTTGCYILTNDILELIPFLMKKQGIPLEEYEKKLKSYQEKWDSKDPEVYNSVEVSFFKIIMNSLKVNKDLIVIIPDAEHLRSMSQVVEREYIGTEYGDGDQVTSKEQAIWCLFQSAVCDVNWKTKSCKKNWKIVDDFKKKYFEETERLMNMRKGTFVTAMYLENIILSLATHRLFSDEIAERVGDYNFARVNYSCLVPIELYTENSNFYGLPEYYDMFADLQFSTVPAYLARSRNSLGWLNTFYPSDGKQEEKQILVEEMLYGFPKNERDSGREFLMNNINGAAVSSAQEETDEMKRLKNLIYNPSILKKMQEASSSSSKSSDEPKKPKEPKKPQKKEPTPQEELSDPPPKPEPPKKVKKAPKEPKPCTKCTENGVSLCKAREELRNIEIVAKSNETKAKKAEKVVKDLENMHLKMKDLQKEIENLSRDLKNFNEQEEKMRVANKDILKEIGNLGQQVEREKQNNVEVHQRNSMLKGKFDEIQLELAKRESEREAMEAKWKGTRNPAPSSSEGPSTYHVPFVPSLPTPDDPQLAENPQWVLEQWNKMKTNFESDDMVQEERQMIEEVLSKLEELDPTAQDFVEYELHQFNATSRIYLQNIELNIRKIEKTGDISNMRPLAKYPCLSEEFMKVYEKVMGE